MVYGIYLVGSNQSKVFGAVIAAQGFRHSLDGRLRLPAKAALRETRPEALPPA